VEKYHNLLINDHQMETGGNSQPEF